MYKYVRMHLNHIWHDHSNGIARLNLIDMNQLAHGAGALQILAQRPSCCKLCLLCFHVLRRVRSLKTAGQVEWISWIFEFSLSNIVQLQLSSTNSQTQVSVNTLPTQARPFQSWFSRASESLCSHRHLLDLPTCPPGSGHPLEHPFVSRTCYRLSRSQPGISLKAPTWERFRKFIGFATHWFINMTWEMTEKSSTRATTSNILQSWNKTSSWAQKGLTFVDWSPKIALKSHCTRWF